MFNFDVPIKTDVFGQFGDIVGGVIGSLWALAGVILFYAGLTEQRKDIQTNQNALEKTNFCFKLPKRRNGTAAKRICNGSKSIRGTKGSLKRTSKKHLEFSNLSQTFIHYLIFT